MILKLRVKQMKKKTIKLKQIPTIILFIMLVMITSYLGQIEEKQAVNTIENNKISYEISNIPEYKGEAYVEINNNHPEFSDEDLSLEQDYYSDLKNGKVRNGNDKNLLEENK